MDKLIDLTSESEGHNQSFSASHSHHQYSSNTKWSPFYLLKSNSILSEHNRQSLSFSDIFQGNFEFAILSNYMIDLNFIFSECERFLCPDVITLILHGSKSSEEGLKSQLENMGLPNVFISLVQVSEAFGTHHCKYALLFYENGVRVVITTANYLDHDFYDMTQGVYVQDFPLLDKSHTTTSQTNNFKRDLLSFLHQANIKEPFCRQLFRDQFKRFDRYDFSIAEVEIVASVPGRHDVQLGEWGQSKLHKILKNRPSDTSTISGIALQMSSISSLGVKDKFYEELISVFKTNPSNYNSVDSKSITTSADREIKTHLIWPTLDTVRNSNKGYISGGSIPAKYKELYIDETSRELKPVIKETLYKWDGSVSGRERIMPHMKCYFAYSLTHVNTLKRKLTTCEYKILVIKNQIKYNKSSEDMNINLSWFLLTSANLSMAAWGTKQSKMEKLYIKSYELGVLFLPEKIFTNKRSFSCTPDHPILGVDIKKSEAEAEFETVEFPLPFKFPPIPYDLKSKSDDDRPWVWDRDYSHFPDRFGRTSCF